MFGGLSSRERQGRPEHHGVKETCRHPLFLDYSGRQSLPILPQRLSSTPLGGEGDGGWESRTPMEMSSSASASNPPPFISSSAWGDSRSSWTQAKCLEFGDSEGWTFRSRSLQVALLSPFLPSAQGTSSSSHPERKCSPPPQPRPKREPGSACKASCPAWPLQGTHFLPFS